jgi:putative addiction module killer protein
MAVLLRRDCVLANSILEDSPGNRHPSTFNYAWDTSLVHGNPGNHRDLPQGISELKIDFGPGYRVYYTMRGNRLLILLAGGDKSTQRKDIVRAIELAKKLQE